MLGRAHTVAAFACMSLVVLVPLSLWIYARVASVDRLASIASNERLYRSVRHMPGARSFGASSYALYRWDVEGALVPITGYRTEYFLRLPRSVPVSSIYRHYERVFHGWRETRDSESVDFMRGRVVIAVTTAETANGTHAREYAFYVSQ